MVAAAAEEFNEGVGDFLRRYGKSLLPRMMEKYPYFIDPGITVKTFLENVHEIIQVEVKKLYPGAVTASFEYDDPADDQLIMLYTSPRKLCDFAIGLIAGAGDYFDVTIELNETSCTKKGDEACRFEIKFIEKE